MRIVQAKKNKPIYIGWQGENEVVTVQFDVSGWSDLYGSGTFTLINQRPTETVGYPCTVTVADDVVSWVVKDVDVFIEGNGHVQLTYTVNGQIAKSIQFFTFVQRSINVGDIPEPLPDWFSEMQQEIDEAMALVQEVLDTYAVATNAEIDAAIYS